MQMPSRRPAIPAHMRRIGQTLESISLEQPEASVWCAGELIGVWRELQPHWQWCGSAYRITFQRSAGVQSFWVSSIRMSRDGLTVQSRSARGYPAPNLEVVWGKDRSWRLTSGMLNEIRQWTQSAFPGSRILAISSRSDLAHSLSASFSRILFRHEGKDSLLLAAAESVAADEAQLGVTHALLWLIRLKEQRRAFSSIPQVHLLVPEGRSGTLRHRAAMLNPSRVKMRVWEYFQENSGFRVRKPSRPVLPVEERDFRWPLLGPFHWSPLLASVLELAPELIRRYPRFQDYDSLRLAGLEFARAFGPERDRVLYGVGSERVEVNPENFADLAALVEEILYFRRPDSPDTFHPYYRLQAERWLETLILEAVPRLFPELQPESAYSQIPVYLGLQAGRVDILGVDREGTLVIMELKITADPNLPVQGLDYWARVVAHNKNGDFERRGYFSNVRLNRRPPKIYLVAPIFDFHDSTEKILTYINPNLEVWKIGINQDWRCGVQVLRRVRLQCSERV
jgi:hypothetical protein